MRGSVLINGVDIADFGVFILRGGDNDFLTFPERRAPIQNNWYEYDGLDVDLSEVYFKERTLSVHFYISAPNVHEYESNLNSFYQLITAGYINLYSREFARTFKLRYLSVTEYNHKGGLYKRGDKRGAFRVDFSMDNPLQLFTKPTIFIPASSKNYSLSGVVLNDYDLAQFGIIVTECYNSVLTQSAVKSPLTRSFSKRNGLLAYPATTPTFEAKEIIVNCTMAAATRAEFYNNYEALFNQVSQPGEIYLDTHYATSEVYYSKMENFEKHGIFAKGVRVSFTLRFMQINAGLIEYLLGTQDGYEIITETDGYNIEV